MLCYRMFDALSALATFWRHGYGEVVEARGIIVWRLRRMDGVPHDGRLTDRFQGR